MQIPGIADVAGVNNAYAVIAVVFLVLSVAALYFFRKEVLWARLVVFGVLFVAAIVLGFWAKPYDPGAPKKAEDALRLQDDAEEKRREELAARFDKVETAITQAVARIDLLEAKDSAQKKKGAAELERAANQAKEAQEALRRAQEAAKTADTARWDEAKTNIRWVFSDAGAKRRYDALRSQGLSKYAAVIGAQSHNPPVQGLLRSLGEARVEEFVSEDLRQ